MLGGTTKSVLPYDEDNTLVLERFIAKVLMFGWRQRRDRITPGGWHAFGTSHSWLGSMASQIGEGRAAKRKMVCSHGWLAFLQYGSSLKSKGIGWFAYNALYNLLKACRNGGGKEKELAKGR